MSSSKIEWLNHIPELKGEVWNVMTGCVKISAGCDNCYAENILNRFKGSCAKFKEGFKPVYHPKSLNDPLKWKAPRLVFVNSISDLFAEHWNYEDIWDVLDVIANNPQHFFLILTKRPQIMANFMDHYPRFKDTKNIGLGVSVENNATSHRIDTLMDIKTAGIKLVSYEPLLELVPVTKFPVDWIIMGEESGKNKRALDNEDVMGFLDSYDQLEVKPPLFIKQLFRGKKKISMPIIGGKRYDNTPHGKILNRLRRK